ncbi:DeoR/GlpR transcriptional regulator [Roseovarius faecimaris]|uniref:DeoR/GlpR transcriptional regulator n=1 Tax=Roseovarius faecimaris TaxID=2494550 RepID=A0A6I6IR80_9RHOB|nr:DeoR/GlpR family DNA-binding transcription regulator [Roseovarius faecimaris]QGX99640.1 DeoR/GlpR transcriptional regulator [Roseovarius faecimaris]
MAKSREKHSTHREVELLDRLRAMGGSARTAVLAEALDVSEETVRRTVKALAKSGVVQRVHGGVYLANTEALAPVVTRLGKRPEEKARIAAAAAELIPSGSCVFLDVGSTTAFVAQNLRNHRDMTVVTNGLHAAQALSDINNNRVFLAGGELQAVSSGVFGPETIAFVERFNLDVAVISVDGFDPRSGFLLAAAPEAALARAVTARAHRVIVVTDHTKFGQNAPMVACAPGAVDVVVTDRVLPPQMAECLAGNGVEVMVVEG